MARNGVILGVAAAVVAVAAILAYVLLADRGTPDETAADPSSEVDYSNVDSAVKVMSLEFERLSQHIESQSLEGLHPRTAAILRAGGPDITEREFFLALGREFHAIRREAAVAFSKRHPEMTNLRMREGDVEGADLETDEIASLPAALGRHSEYIEIFESWPDGASKDKDSLFSAETPNAIAANPQRYSTFMQKAAIAESRLQAVLDKPEIISFPHPGVAPEDEIAFPVPVDFDRVVFGRIHIHIAMGRLDRAGELCGLFLQLLERADMSSSGIGPLQKVVLSSKLIRFAVVPCAQYGALSADDLVEMCTSGRAMPLQYAAGLANELVAQILWYQLSDWWTSPQDTRAGIMGFVYLAHGPATVDEWFASEEREWPLAIGRFEEAWPAMRDGHFDVRDAKSAKAFEDLVSPRFSILTTGLDDPSNIGWTRDALGIRSEWLQLLVRAEEMRRDKSFLQFPEKAAKLLQDPWIEIRCDKEVWEVYVSRDRMQQLGIKGAGEIHQYSLEPVEYGLNAVAD